MSILCSSSPEFFAPAPKQKQARGNRVEQTALCHEHRKWNTFPSDGLVSLIIEKLKKGGRVENLKSRDPAIEQKSGYAECSAPAIKCIKGRERGEQSGPNQTAGQIQMQATQQIIKQVDTRRISLFA